MAIIEKSGFLKYKDASGNTTLMYPITTKDNVDGMDDIDAHVASQENPHNVTADQIGAISYSAQSLTDEQKTQVKENIGVNELPEGATAHQQLVTDADGNVKWEDRTHYEQAVKTTVIENVEITTETDGTFAANHSLSFTFKPTVGQEYIVSFNGEEYRCITYLDQYNEIVIGNIAIVDETGEDTGEPFFYYYFEDSGETGYGLVTREPGTYTFGVSELNAEITKLPSRFLEDTVMDRLLPNETPSENQQFVTDAKGNVKWEEKSHYDYITLTSVLEPTEFDVSTPDTGVWEGEGAYTNEPSEDGEDYGFEIGQLYRVQVDNDVYDEVICDHMQYMGAYVSGELPNSGKQVLVANMGFIVLTNYEPGIHTISIRKINPAVKPIDPKYLSGNSPSPYQQFVTDEHGTLLWEERTHYYGTKITTVTNERVDFTYNSTYGCYIGYADELADWARQATHIEWYYQQYVPLNYVILDGSGSDERGYYGNGYIYDKALPNTGERFVILVGSWTEEPGQCIMSNEKGPNRSLKFRIIDPNYAYPLDSKWIPTTVPVIQSATAGQTIVVKTVDENGKPTEWETADAAPKNHTHTENVTVRQDSSPSVQLSLNNSSSGTRLYKNASATADYGTTLADYNSTGTRDSLILCRNNALDKKLYINVGNDDGTGNTPYYLYGEHHKPTASEVGALSTSGGTVNGDVNVAGVLKANGQQAFYYATTSNSQTIGTANATGGTTIACGASANTVINGANVKTNNVLPNDSNTHTLGNTTYRWKEIYSNTSVNVSSDERLKRNISEVDDDAFAQFVNGLDVVSYNYTDDPEDANSRIGLIAQAVQSVDPEIAKYFVSEDSDGMLSLKPADLVFPLIIAVQKLTARVNELEAAK